MSDGQAHVGALIRGRIHSPPLHDGPGYAGHSGERARARPHHPKLQHHFDDMAQQAEASTLGMWVFLVTEIMFFGGLFMAYLVYRTPVADGFPGGEPPPERHRGARVNTIVLIVSSLTMALAVRAAQTSAPPKTQVFWIVVDDAARRGVPRRQGDRVHRQVHAPPRARAELRSGTGSTRRRRRCSTRCTSA